MKDNTDKNKTAKVQDRYLERTQNTGDHFNRSPYPPEPTAYNQVIKAQNKKKIICVEIYYQGRQDTAGLQNSGFGKNTGGNFNVPSSSMMSTTQTPYHQVKGELAKSTCFMTISRSGI